MSSHIPARGTIPSVVGLGQRLKELGGNDMGKSSVSSSWENVSRCLLDMQKLRNS